MPCGDSRYPAGESRHIHWYTKLILWDIVAELAEAIAAPALYPACRGERAGVKLTCRDSCHAAGKTQHIIGVKL